MNKEPEEKDGVLFEDWLDLVKELGPLTVKLLITVNGGAAIVFMTFFGSLDQNSYYVLPLSSVILAMSILAAGLILPLAVNTFSYFSAAKHVKGRPIRFLNRHLVDLNIFAFSVSLLALPATIATLALTMKVAVQ